jgi:hypothetical protein
MRKSKTRKQTKAKLNSDLSINGRTAVQVKKIRAKNQKKGSLKPTFGKR